MPTCPICGKRSRRTLFSPNVHPSCWQMKFIDKQKQGTLDDIFNIQPEEVKENDKQIKKNITGRTEKE